MFEQTHATTDIRPLPTELASSQSKLVYLYLEASGGATADELGQALTMKKITTLSVLGSLSNQELVEKHGVEYVPAK